MTEVSLSTANIKFAVDIKPADISPAPTVSTRESSTREARQASFDDTLARAVQDRAAKNSPSATQSGNAVENKGPSRNQAEKPSRKRDGDATENSGENAANSPAASTARDGPMSKTPATEDGSSSEAKPVTSAEPAANGKVSDTASSAADSPTALFLSQTASGYYLGLLVDSLSDAIVPGQDETDGVNPASSAGTESQSATSDPNAVPTQIVVTPDRRFMVEIPLIETLKGAIDLPAPQPASTGPSILTGAETLRNSSLNGSSGPSGDFIAGRSSEWTEILEFSRLLNPTIERDTSPVTRMTNPSLDAQAWRPEIRQASEVPREPMQSRFGEPATATRAPAIYEASIRVTQSATPVDARQVVAEPLVFARNLYRSPVEAVNQASQAGTAAETASATTQARPGVPVDFASTRFEIDSETLVSDVREAVMRIAADGRGEARITLHPPELGELVVRLESARNGIVRVEFHTLSPLVREALEAGLSKLTDALKSEGLTLEQANVYLSFHLGAEGNAGESNPGSAPGTPTIGAGDETLVSNPADESAPTVEWLPEGATISILA